MITAIFDKNIVKILTLVSISSGSKFQRKEIKDKLIINNVPLDKALSTLVKTGILKQEKRLYSMNFEYKHANEILRIIKSEHIRFKEVPLKVYFALIDSSASLSQIQGIHKAYLFGSYAKLIYTDKSDVDIAIFFDQESSKLKKLVNQAIHKIEKKYSKNIETHYFNKKDLKKKDPLIKEILRNNVVLF
ncbi:MAG: nucleotidyltransferase domain-containing protein [Nanoarchaeota archaeon]|nr:nucleotidyltransferase domain-containing protein [Nanoarchaeota archaeon]MBU1322360.1 nucleotidyltransferase domain-containing protein [Nanoarchaeota archaeon]MBU1596973.1 nucleotidyltransferase domain-containing protein [Nanoarchaeota archaeon]MBU2441692.1 nucleotidyltransferase domain-containing protein [Nanoarchaeota archaeon]